MNKKWTQLILIFMGTLIIVIGLIGLNNSENKESNQSFIGRRMVWKIIFWISAPCFRRGRLCAGMTIMGAEVTVKEKEAGALAD